MAQEKIELPAELRDVVGDTTLVTRAQYDVDEEHGMYLVGWQTTAYRQGKEPMVLNSTYSVEEAEEAHALILRIWRG